MPTGLLAAMEIVRLTSGPELGGGTLSTEQAQVSKWDESTPEDRRMVIRFANWCTRFQKAHPDVLYLANPDHLRLAWALFYLNRWSSGGLSVRMIDGEPSFPWVTFEKVLGCDSEVIMEIEEDIDGHPTGYVCRDRGIPYVRVDSLPAVIPLLPDYLMSDQGQRRLRMLIIVCIRPQDSVTA